MTLHLRPTAPIAPDALLPGDPGRALALAQHLLAKPTMSNHHRGLWGYSGETRDGRPLTIQATGMGGPSAAIVLTELAEHGVQRAIRVGSCGALDPNLRLGDLLVIESALSDDGTSRRLAATESVSADTGLSSRLAAAADGVPVTVASTDLFYELDGERPRSWSERGATAVEMEAATLFALGERLDVAVAAVVAVSDVFRDGRRTRIADEDLLAAGLRMGELAVRALAAAR